MGASDSKTKDAEKKTEMVWTFARTWVTTIRTSVLTYGVLQMQTTYLLTYLLTHLQLIGQYLGQKS